jgi:ABC-type multidrug transport system ATPase subunit
MTNTLEFDSLELWFEKRPILSGIYVKCAAGEVVGILGRNGSGKSSLMKIVFGSLKASHQSIRINGESLPYDFIEKRLIGYLPQDNLIPSFLSIRKALKLFGVDEGEIMKAFPETEDVLGLYPQQLSAGSLRIIEALLILKSKALFCILDEPFTGLMPVNIDKLKQIISAEKKKKGIIITDHLYRHVLSLTDRLYLLANGRTYQVKDEEDLMTRGYLNTLP